MLLIKILNKVCIWIEKCVRNGEAPRLYKWKEIKSQYKDWNGQQATSNISIRKTKTTKYLTTTNSNPIQIH